MKVDLETYEDNGIKEQEFSELFKYEPIYTLPQFGKFLYGSQILNDQKIKAIIREIKS